MNHCFNPARRSLLAGLALWPLAARPAAAPTAVMLAVEAPDDIDPAGWLVSEKYDGVRAWWDGARLCTRTGHDIAAPGWFLRHLPALALDGELWAGRGHFEALSGAVRRQQPEDAAWQRITYMAFDLPRAGGPFSERAERLAGLGQDIDWPGFQAVEQRRLGSRADLQRWLREVVAGGGEGLMLHRADAAYLAGRNPVLQKLKPVHDADAMVLDVVPGRGRHSGRMGALRVRTPEGRQFLLGTGFSDAQRETPPASGSIVTYRHRGHTEAGLPRGASFLRVRQPAAAPGAAQSVASKGVSQAGSGP